MRSRVVLGEQGGVGRSRELDVVSQGTTDVIL